MENVSLRLSSNSESGKFQIPVINFFLRVFSAKKKVAKIPTIPAESND